MGVASAACDVCAIGVACVVFSSFTSDQVEGGTLEDWIVRQPETSSTCVVCKVQLLLRVLCVRLCHETK